MECCQFYILRDNAQTRLAPPPPLSTCFGCFSAHHSPPYHMLDDNILMFATLACLAMVAVCAQCNIWDNIFSETEASSPIILSESINVEFPFHYQQYELEGVFDFNSETKVLSLVVEKDLGLLKVKGVFAQLHLDSMTVVEQAILRGCEIFKLEVFEDKLRTDFTGAQIRSKQFLINIFFEYLRREKQNNVYQLSPDLILPHTQEHEDYQINPVLLVSSKGQVSKIYSDLDMKSEIKFSLQSKIKEVLKCPKNTPVRVITQEDLKEIVASQFTRKNLEKIAKLAGPEFDELEEKGKKLEEKGEKLEDKIKIPDLGDLGDLEDLIPNLPIPNGF